MHALGVVARAAAQQVRAARRHTVPLLRMASATSCSSRRASTAAAGTGLLAGVRVLDLTRILAGPWCTMLLGDMGADVIKIEAHGGDDTRKWGPPFVDTPTGRVSSYFLCANKNKRSVVVDFRTPAGREVIHRLASVSDVLVENYLPGKLASLGFGYEELAKRNPRLIYASLSGFGQTGPSAHKAGYDVAIAAHGGLMAITGPQDGEPAKVGVAVTDLSTGLYLHGAILAALFARERTGVGQRIDTSLVECQVANLANVASNVLTADWPTRRWGTAHESIVPYQAFPASDGDFIVAAMNDAQFRGLCGVIGRPELAADDRYATNAARVAHRDLLLPLLKAVFATRPKAEWIAAIEAAGITVAPINSPKEALSDPQVLHRQMVVDAPYPAAPSATSGVGVPATAAVPPKPVKIVGLPVKFSDPAACSSIRLPPPALGEHTDEVLREVLGFSEEAIATLRRDRVVA